MADAETNFSRRPPHFLHFTGGLSLIFWKTSRWSLHFRHSNSYIGIGCSPPALDRQLIKLYGPHSGVATRVPAVLIALIGTGQLVAFATSRPVRYDPAELHPMSDTAKSLSLERKIKMQEAREGIINRLALTLPTTINLDRFLNVIVSELGRMMNVDRCDVIQLTSPRELRISHEWRAADDVPSSLGTALPLDLQQLSEHVDITR